MRNKPKSSEPVSNAANCLMIREYNRFNTKKNEYKSSQILMDKISKMESDILYVPGTVLEQCWN